MKQNNIQFKFLSSWDFSDFIVSGREDFGRKIIQRCKTLITCILHNNFYFSNNSKKILCHSQETRKLCLKDSQCKTICHMIRHMIGHVIVV